MNDAGLAVSLTFGGRRVMGDGFGIPIVVRYLLEVCETVRSGPETIARLPFSLAHNLTIVDRAGDVVTAYVSPDRDPIFRPFPAATNHQGLVEWPDQAKATRTIEREQCIVRLVEGDAPDVEAFADAFLRSPLFSTSYANGWGTLYTAVFRPSEGVVDYRWPTDSWRLGFEAFAEGEHVEVLADAPLGDGPQRPGTRAEAAMRTETFRMETGGRRVHDVTERVARFAADVDDDGLLHVFVPHATAGVALMETGSGSETDLDELLERVFPATTATRIGMGRSATAATICSPSSSRRRWSCPWWGARCSWAPGSRSCWSTRTARTTFGPCGSASCPAEAAATGTGRARAPRPVRTRPPARRARAAARARHRRARPPGPTRAGTARGRLPSPPHVRAYEGHVAPRQAPRSRRRGRRDQEAARALALAALGVPHHQAVTREPDRRPDGALLRPWFPLRGRLGAGLLRRARGLSHVGESSERDPVRCLAMEARRCSPAP